MSDLSPKCPTCGRRKKGKQMKMFYAERLCKMMEWDDSNAWYICNASLNQDALKQITERLGETHSST